MQIKAPAKINLGLKIGQRRDDGFHEIETVFVELDGLADELHFELREDGEIEWEIKDGVILDASEAEGSLASAKGFLDSSAAADSLGMTVGWQKEDDLAFRAAKLLQTRFDVKKGVSIQLTKNIPVGAGLGGGSSDAAATLKALNELWELNLSLNELEKLAAELGSDCPFFIRGGVQLGTGRGEILEPFTLPADFPRHVVLVTPEIHVNTAAAFAAIDENPPQPPFAKGGRRSEAKWGDLANDFEPVIFAQHPELDELKQRLLDAGAAAASLSGSGSTVFGLFYEKPEIELSGVLHARIKA